MSTPVGVDWWPLLGRFADRKSPDRLQLMAAGACACSAAIASAAVASIIFRKVPCMAGESASRWQVPAAWA